MIDVVTYRWQGEEGDAEQGAARGDDFARPSYGHCIAIANCTKCYLGELLS